MVLKARIVQLIDFITLICRSPCFSPNRSGHNGPMESTDRSSTYLHIRVDRPSEHVARVTLHRPEVANALDALMIDELADAVESIARDDDVHVWLLAGSPRPDGRPWFSSGVDMSEALAHPDRRPATSPVALVDRIDDLLKPSIAVIDGTCTTGALELALACDLRFAAADAQISDWHMVRSGLGIGSWGMATRLSRLVGLDKAKELLLLSQVIDGNEAKAIGLVNRTVESPQLMSAALGAAATIAAMPRRGVRTTLGFLSLQSGMSKQESMRWADLAPELMGVQLRPFSDAADRFMRTKPDRRS